ncbi:MAG TPA: MFS transporter [Thermoanaerobaculia bacterium]|nr:MFS transporter [Thermoanaerobaculia bacterium]
MNRNAWKALFAAQLGWALDAMDFLLFTFALRSIQQEFLLQDSTMGLLTSVALVAAAGGGILFGRLADRFGRVRAMTWSILIYSLATGLLATSHSVFELVLWRAVLGIGMGGEWSAGSVLVAETWPAEHRAKAMGLMQSGWAIGALVAAGLSALLLESYGWRVLFLVGAFPALVAFVIRKNVAEPEIWQRSREVQKRSASPVFSRLFRAPHLRHTVLATALASSVLVAYWGLFSWLPSFLATSVERGGAGLTITRSATWMILIQVGAFAGYVSFGWFADRLGRRPAFALFMVGASLVVPLYALAPSTMVLALVGPLVGFFGSGYFSLFGALLSELYPTEIRGTAQGFCYNAGRLVSALAPFLIGVAATTSGLGVALGINASFFALAGILVWLLPETKGQALTSGHSSEPAAAR